MAQGCKLIQKDITTLTFNQKVILTIEYLILLYRHIHIGHKSLCINLKLIRGKDITLKKTQKHPQKNPKNALLKQI